MIKLRWINYEAGIITKEATYPGLFWDSKGKMDYTVNKRSSLQFSEDDGATWNDIDFINVPFSEWYKGEADD